MSDNPVALAKLIWHEPETGALQEYILNEGVSVTVGRSQDNEIYIPEKTVSRHHVTIAYRSGVFTITDMQSANGTFVNEDQISDVYPLIHGDEIRLYGPIMRFEAIPLEIDEEAYATQQPSDLEDTVQSAGNIDIQYPYISIASGDLMGQRIPLDKPELTFGRAISNAAWEVPLPDHAVSRPHARIYRKDDEWFVEDLGSSNGTMVGGNFISRPTRLSDETIITMGETTIIFHGKPH